MRPLRLLRASVMAFCLLLLSSPASFAQLSPSPKEPPGLCAPWHKCVATVTLGAVVLYLLFLFGMYAYQRRGFDRLEHRQGNPEGVPTKQK